MKDLSKQIAEAMSKPQTNQPQEGSLKWKGSQHLTGVILIFLADYATEKTFEDICEIGGGWIIKGVRDQNKVLCFMGDPSLTQQGELVKFIQYLHEEHQLNPEIWMERHHPEVKPNWMLSLLVKKWIATFMIIFSAMIFTSCKTTAPLKYNGGILGKTHPSKAILIRKQ
jgi:hypothetical protein